MPKLDACVKHPDVRVIAESRTGLQTLMIRYYSLSIFDQVFCIGFRGVINACAEDHLTNLAVSEFVKDYHVLGGGGCPHGSVEI